MFDNQKRSQERCQRKIFKKKNKKPYETIQRVLVCGPQADVKKYCFKEWAENVKKLTYPVFDVFLADNSLDKEFSEEIKKEGFWCVNVTNDKNKHSVLKRLAQSHELCRKVAVKYKYDYILHLETDVFPPVDVIERLMFQNKEIVAGYYDLGEGSMRIPMLNTLSSEKHPFRTATYGRFNRHLIDGKTHKILSAGLGCVLIKREVFVRFPFRYIEGQSWFPDVVWINDLYAKNIPYYVDTSIVCTHKNSDWGEYGKDYK